MWLRAFLLFCLTASVSRAEPVTIFAAASLKTALDEIAETYPADLRFSFAGSSILARQIAAGAPADAYLSANTAWMDWVEGQGALLPETRRDLIGNSLVLITRDTPGLPWETGDRVAMGLTNAVPAGIYGRQALHAMGHWDALTIVQTDNVRAALALVALGEVPFGVVYASDARAEPRVTIAHPFDPAMHDPITYPGAALTPAGAAFLDHLQTPAAQAIFAAQGFEVAQ